MKRQPLLVLVAVGSLLGLAACGGPTEGEALPNNQPTTATTTTDATSSAPSPDGPLASVDPCSLLSPQQVQQLGTPKLTDQGEVGSARTCTWQSPLDVSPARAVGVGIREQQGLKAFQGDFQEATVAGRKVKIQCDPDCLIGIDVTETSRVDIQGSIVGDKAGTRKYAKQVAEMVISNLPQG